MIMTVEDYKCMASEFKKLEEHQDHANHLRSFIIEKIESDRSVGSCPFAISQSLLHVENVTAGIAVDAIGREMQAARISSMSIWSM